MNKIRVLQFIPGFKYGGIETITYNLCKYIDKEKVQIDLIIETKEKLDLLEEYKKLGCNIYRIEKFNILNIYNYYKQLNTFFIGNKYDIIHAYNITRTPILFLVAKKFGIKNRVFHARTNLTSTNFFRRIIYRIFIILGKNLATKRMACSEVAGNYFFGNTKVIVVKNGIESNKFIYNQTTRMEIREKYNLSNNFIIGHVGRYCDAKNHTFIIDVFKSVSEKRNDAYLMLVGDGPLLTSIKNKVEKLGLTDKVIFVGAKDDVYKYYQAMDILVFPSIYEGFGNVVVEAQASGLRVLASTNVPKSVKVTDLVDFLPLNNSNQEWARELIDKGEKYERRNTHEEIVKSGYDIIKNAAFMENYYIDLAREK
jgi:glycosyltransferase involved in cell wall biosynthesis